MISQIVYSFVSKVIEKSEYTEMDRIYLQNKVLDLIGLGEFSLNEYSENELSMLDLANKLIDQAVLSRKINDISDERNILEAKLFDLITPSPTEVNSKFNELYLNNPKDATDYFFSLSKENNYIKVNDIAKNIIFPAETEYGNLEITINLSKPEKDPKAIATQGMQASDAKYPKCALCIENEGYAGRLGFAARTNHRLIRHQIGNEVWNFQYSPYAYYNEHCIILSQIHRPMKIDRNTFKNLIDIVDWLPHYFAGSNADLPIVGGSILSHDHYQGGRHTFPMEMAPIEYKFQLKDFPTVNAGIVKWPMSVIRLQSEVKDDLINASMEVFDQWNNYSNPELDIYSYKDGVRHHTVTPIARRRDGLYELDLVLRDNNISEEYPDGIFHPHKDVQHIKKENIGLIEVMGLAILPPRLVSEMNEVEHFLLDEPNEINEYHLDWAKSIKKINKINQNNVHELVRKEIGKTFKRVLEDAGVFKRNERGQEAFVDFVNTI